MRASISGWGRRLALGTCLMLVSLPGLRARDVIFRDDFNGGKSPQWREVNDGPRAGGFREGNGSYVLTSDDPLTCFPRALVDGDSDYFIQADVDVTALHSSFATAALLAYYTDSDHFYEFAVDRLHGYWTLQRYDKSGTSPLARGSTSSLSGVHTLGLYAKDGDIRAFIDGVMVAQRSDGGGLKRGAFGLSARGAECRWDNVLVEQSDPDAFFYDFTTRNGDSRGEIDYGDVSFLVVDPQGKRVASVTSIRIYRDAVSYYLFQDRKTGRALRSGFASEFQKLSANRYRVKVPSSQGPIAGSHLYTSAQVEWLLAFLRQSARYLYRGVTGSLDVTSKLYLLSGSFITPGGAPITDRELGPSGRKAELIGLNFGKWEEAGNYKQSPLVAGKTEGSTRLLERMAAACQVPQGSVYSLYVYQLAGGSSPPVSLAWLLQGDSRALVAMQSVSLPAGLQPDYSYTIPYVIQNLGEAAGAFDFSIVLSDNRFVGRRDTVLATRSFRGMDAGEEVSSQIEATVPASTRSGVYYIGTLLEREDDKDRILRVRNDSSTVRSATVGSAPPNGSLTAILRWEGAVDLDLHSTDPYGETIYYYDRRSVAGGELAQDRECGGGAEGERIEYPAGTAATGAYRFSVHYFRSCGGPDSVPYTLEIRSDKGGTTFSGVVGRAEIAEAGTYTR